MEELQRRADPAVTKRPVMPLHHRLTLTNVPFASARSADANPTRCTIAEFAARRSRASCGRGALSARFPRAPLCLPFCRARR